jgi:soluble cytochrome b562
VLAQLYGYQSTQPAFREKVATLSGLCDRLGKATKAKDEAASQKALDECEALLAELAKAAPPNDRTTDKGFKPLGSTKTWMLLVDGTYSDAKAAKDPKQVEHYAYTIAEGCNAMAHLRTDPRWRQESLAVRDAALQAAQKAQAGELGPAREALKVVYQTCENCHQRYRKK